MLRPRFEYLERRRSEIDPSLIVGTAIDAPISQAQEDPTQPDRRESVRIDAEERSAHTYTVGVSGSGKSRFLFGLLAQDLAKGHPIVLIDPMGDFFDRARAFLAACLEDALDRDFPLAPLRDRFRLLDAGDPSNPWRINPLAPHPGESVEEQVDDLLKALERLSGRSFEDQWRIRNILRGLFTLISELNRLPPELQPRTGLGLEELGPYPLTLHAAADLLRLSGRDVLRLFQTLPESERLRFRRRYLEYFAASSRHQQDNLLQSSWNALQYLLDDDLVRNVLSCRESTLDFPEMLASGTSLLVRLPFGRNLAGVKFLGRFLTTKLQNAMYRRPQKDWARRCFLYLDEFHFFVDQTFAESMTNLRKYGLSVINAHQSMTQPPFDTQEGQALLRTIKANSRLKIAFRLDRPDAESLGRDLFELSQRRPNFEDVSQAETESQGTTKGTGFSTSSNRSHGTSSNRALETDRINQGTSDRNQSGHSNQHNESESEGRSQTRSKRTVYYSLEGERELLVNRLQRLPDRECWIFPEALRGRRVRVSEIPDEWFALRGYGIAAVLRQPRLAPKTEPTPTPVIDRQAGESGEEEARVRKAREQMKGGVREKAGPWGF